MNDVRDRYLRDPVFHTVVDHMGAIIRGAVLTPSEVREAAMLACVIEEQYRPRAPFSTEGNDLEELRAGLSAEACGAGALDHNDRRVRFRCTRPIGHTGDHRDERAKRGWLR